MLKIYRMLLAMFTPHEQRLFMVLLVVIVFSALIETVGVATILPFLAILSDPEIIRSNTWLAWSYETLGFTTDQEYMVFIGLAVFGVVVLGLVVKTLALYAMMHFSFMCAASISTRLLGGYLHQPYAWFLNRNSADLGKSLLSEIDRLNLTVFGPAMRLLANAAVVLFLTGLIILVNPVIALSAAGFIFISYGLIYLGLRNSLARLGEERLVANGQRFQIAQEALGGAKEVKLLGLESAYAERFRKPARSMARALTVDTVVGESPRYILEGIAFGGMLLLIVMMLISDGGSLERLLPILGVYAFAGLRLFPALQMVFRIASGLRFNYSSLERLHRDLIEVEQNMADRPPGAPPAPMELTRSIELDDVHYAYPQAERAALNGLSLEIPANTTLGIVGGTGAGKTTAVDIILALLMAETGELRVDGVPVTAANRRAWQRSIGYVPQQIFLTDESVRGNIAFGVPAEKINHAAVERAARIAELHDFVLENLPEGYDTMVGERGVRLSGGQRQRIGIARALYHDPAVLILDEATSALDNLTPERAVMDAVHNLGRAKTTIMIAHRLTTVRDCDMIVMLENGRVISSGTWHELLDRSQKFRAMASGDVGA